MHLLIFNKVLCNILIDIFFRHPSLILNVIILIEPDVNPFGAHQTQGFVKGEDFVYFETWLAGFTSRKNKSQYLNQNLSPFTFS